jgi:hypothetical protein
MKRPKKNPPNAISKAAIWMELPEFPFSRVAKLKIHIGPVRHGSFHISRTGINLGCSQTRKRTDATRASSKQTPKQWKRTRLSSAVAATASDLP